jgi:hypothetical protein
VDLHDPFAHIEPVAPVAALAPIAPIAHHPAVSHSDLQHDPFAAPSFIASTTAGQQANANIFTPITVQDTHTPNTAVAHTSSHTASDAFGFDDEHFSSFSAAPTNSQLTSFDTNTSVPSTPLQSLHGMAPISPEFTAFNTAPADLSPSRIDLFAMSPPPPDLPPMQPLWQQPTPATLSSVSVVSHFK